MSKNTGDGELDDSIDVRYAPDLETAFNRFIKKWCGKYYPHLIDSDENDGQFIRDKIAQEANSARLDEIDRIFNNPDWEDKKVGEVPSVAILDFLYERSEELTKEKESSE